MDDEEFDDDLVDIDTVKQEQTKMHLELMEENQRMQLRNRRQAQKCLQRAEVYNAMAFRENEMAAVYIITAKALTELIGDEIASEFDLDITEIKGGEVDDDSE